LAKNNDVIFFDALWAIELAERAVFLGDAAA
jgi:hypothetical protein